MIMANNEAIRIMKKLMDVLPDSTVHGKDWIHCWNELSDVNQDMVKEARSHALEFIQYYTEE